MFRLYLSISCVSSWSFPATLSVLVFHVPMVILSLPRIFDDAPVSYLAPSSWCTAEGAVHYWPRQRPIRYGMVACFHHMMRHGQSTTWRNTSLSRSNTRPLSSSWNSSAHLVLVFELRRYPPSDAVLTPIISLITGRLVESGSILFLPVQVQRTCPLPPPPPQKKATTTTTNINNKKQSKPPHTSLFLASTWVYNSFNYLPSSRLREPWTLLRSRWSRARTEITSEVAVTETMIYEHFQSRSNRERELWPL